MISKEELDLLEACAADDPVALKFFATRSYSHEVAKTVYETLSEKYKFCMPSSEFRKRMTQLCFEYIYVAVPKEANLFTRITKDLRAVIRERAQFFTTQFMEREIQG